MLPSNSLLIVTDFSAKWVTSVPLSTMCWEEEGKTLERSWKARSSAAEGWE